MKCFLQKCANQAGRVIGSAAFLFASLSWIAASQAMAKQVDFRPEWAGYLSTHGQVNHSFLQNLEENRIASRAEEIQDWIMDPSWAVTLKQQYRDMTRNYEMREAYDLNTLEDERAHSDQMSRFGESIADEVRKRHINENLQKARKEASKLKNDPIVQQIKKPVGLAVAVAATSIGEPLKFKLTENTRFTARTHIWNQYGQFEMQSPLLNSSVVFAPKRHAKIPKLLDPIEKESYLVSASRPIPFIDVTTGVSYGGTTTNLTASLGKALTSHLSCSLDSSRPLNPKSSATPQGEEVLRFLYSIGF